MGTQFNIFEILQIAEEVEHKAAEFYRNAAQRFLDEERRHVCHRLAADRTRQQQVWARLRRKYVEQTREMAISGPDGYLLSSPQVMAGLTCFATQPDSHAKSVGPQTREQILRDAIQRARDLMVFYHGLKEFAGDPDSRAMIDTMIRAEDRRIRLLSRDLEQRPSLRRADERPAPR